MCNNSRPKNSRENLVSNIKKLSSNSGNIIPNIDDRYNYNCWGFTATVKGFNGELTWLDCDDMEYYLREKTIHICKSKAKVGDIIVFRENLGELSHTAILISPKNEEYIHKPGEYELEINNLEGILGEYFYGYNIEFRRSIA